MVCTGCGVGSNAVLTQEMKDVISQSPFIPITTISTGGQPHLIVVGRVKEIPSDDTLIFGVYKMLKTRQNLADTGVIQAAAVAGKKGYRFTGKGIVEGDRVIFTVEKAEALL